MLKISVGDFRSFSSSGWFISGDAGWPNGVMATAFASAGTRSNCFTPDQLDASLSPEPHVVDGDSWLMVRGEFPHRQNDLMLPSTARF